jgi:hypothetical protein
MSLSAKSVRETVCIMILIHFKLSGSSCQNLHYDTKRVANEIEVCFKPETKGCHKVVRCTTSARKQRSNSPTYITIF